MQGDPAGVASHHFENHHAVVRFGGRMKTIERLCRDVERGDEAEGQLRTSQVVINSLGHADQREAEPVKLRRDGERAFSAEDDQSVYAEAFEIRERFAVNLSGFGDASVRVSLDEAATVARAENRPAARQ